MKKIKPIFILYLFLMILSFATQAQQNIVHTNFSNGLWEQVDKGIQRKWIAGSQGTFAHWKFEKGAHVAAHKHPNEQFTYITKGSVKVLMMGKEYIVKAGGVLVIPPDVTHEFFSLEDGTEDLDFFAPVRKDWLQGTASYISQQEKALEVVARFDDVRPGNVAVNKQGRVFATIHPLGNPAIQLVEIIDGKAVPYPSKNLQKNSSPANDKTFDTPLGITIDHNNQLWMIDMGLKLGKTRLWHIDLNKNKVTDMIELSQDIAPKGSFVQDVVIDEKNGWAYLADIAKPGIIALNLKTKKARRFSNHPALEAEDIDMMIDGRVTNFGGKPARVGVNPITLSADRETLFFGAMNGNTWYQLSAALLRKQATDNDIAASIKKFGPKPISDGAAIDVKGNHYITDLEHHSITKLSADGMLSSFVKDSKLKWPDNIAIAGGYLYISVNQLNTTPAFTGKQDEGVAPYFIYRVKM